MKLKYSAIILSLLLAAFVTSAAPAAKATYSPAAMEPPAVTREFRAMWIATVANIDWPSAPGLPVWKQKAELAGILDKAVKLNFNVVILQVRSVCDAMYPSRIEPWSYYLTGAMGKTPWPFYDPLAFAVEEAHKRGLELHTWFSPYRAGHPSQKPPFSPNHISQTHPSLVHQYGTLLWLDPGEKEAQDYSLSVIMDVVNRYDIDGVHFDDRLGYPTEDDAQGKHIEFPDYATWKRYAAAGGKLSRDDWRRENVNTFVHRVYDSIKSAKPWVKFGIAPTGIWQSGNPPQIKGQSAYAVLFTDSRKWLINGWLDYCSPQLYWAINPPDTSFPVLLKWWLEQNPKHRNIWPGINSGKVGGNWKAEEIIRQITITREQCGGAPGVTHYSAKCLMENRGGIASALANGVYAKPAVVPASPWLEQKAPGKPILTVENGRKLKWEVGGMENISVWVLQTKLDNEWHTSILPGGTTGHSLTGSPEFVSITAIDRCGVASPPAVLQRDASAEK